MGFPLHTAYIGEYLHFRYLKWLVINWFLAAWKFLAARWMNGWCSESHAGSDDEQMKGFEFEMCLDGGFKYFLFPSLLGEDFQFY